MGRRSAKASGPAPTKALLVAAAPPAAPSAWLDRAPLVAAVVAMAVYLPSLGGGFLYDDEYLIVRNRSIRELSAIGTILRWNRTRPVLNLSWAFNYAVSGLDPWSYHLGNVLIHAGNAALLASLFLWMAVRVALPRPKRAALVGACLFAASPMAAETVAYVSSRSTGLSTLLALASLRLGVEVLERLSLPRLLASLGLLAVALATKEEAAAAPLLLLLLDFFFIARQQVVPMLGRLRTHALYLALPIAGLAGRRLATGGWLPASEMDRLHYAVLEWTAFPQYLLRQLVPLDPALYRGHAAWPPPASAFFWGLGTLVVLVGAIAGRRRWPLWSFAVAWLAASLSPSSSIVPLGEAIVDHRAYLGGAGIAFAIGTLLSRPRAAALAATVVAVFAIRAVQYEAVLADPARAWEDACRRAPGSALPLRGLATAYAAKGDPRVEEVLRRALALDPADEASWTNLGTLYGGRGQLAEAEQAFRRALAVASPETRGYVHDNIGTILQALHRDPEAAAEFESAIAAAPGLAQPRISLAELLIRRGESARARALLDEAQTLLLTPDDARWLERVRQQLR